MTNKERCKNCIHKAVCTYQDYFDNVDHLGERCKQYMSKDLINRLKEKNSNLSSDLTSAKAEIERLQSMNQSKLDMIHDLRAEIERQKAEIERLKEELPDNKYGNRVRVKNGLICTNTLDDYDRLIGDISSEAIKEFADSVLEEISDKVTAATPTQMYTVGQCVGLIAAMRDKMVGERE